MTLYKGNSWWDKFLCSTHFFSSLNCNWCVISWNVYKQVSKSNAVFWKVQSPNFSLPTAALRWRLHAEAWTLNEKQNRPKLLLRCLVVGVTILCWIFSLYFTTRNQNTIEKKESEFLRKRDKKLPVEFSTWRMLKWTILVTSIWLMIAIGFCLSQPLNEALTRNNSPKVLNEKSTTATP